MRNIILSIFGVLLVLAAVYGGKILVEKKNKPTPVFKKEIKTVFTKPINNKEIPIVLYVSGSLTAKNKIELFSEVQGVLKPSLKPFKEGTIYSKGATLLSINSDEFYANLQSQKSLLVNAITAILPDLRLDYPDDFSKWENYIKHFNIDKTTPKLPLFSSDKEKYFVSGRGIVTSYYNVKNLEARMAKHQIKAPFSGILTEALVTSGSLVRMGQKLGEFIDPKVYEMEVSVNAEFADLLKIGNLVKVTNLEKTKTYTGKVVRVNGKVDQVSQTIKVYISLQHPELKEGLFLEANLIAKSVKDAIEISRKLLVKNKSVYIVKKDSILKLQNIEPVYFGEEKVVIKGLQNNDKILTQTLPGAFDGMIVKTNKQK